MLFKGICYIDENFNAAYGNILVEDGKIVKISEEYPEGYEGEVYDGEGKVLIPGLVNAHCHVAMTLMRGYGDGLPLEEWLFTKIFPFEDKMDDEAAYAGSMVGISEMLAGGVTSFTDMYMFPEGICKAVIESGIKCNYGRSIADMSESELTQTARFKEALETKGKYDGAAGGRLKVEFDLHSVYTSSDKVMRRFAEYIKEKGERIRVHMAETETEVRNCKEKYGKSPVKYFNDIGLFDTGCLAAHCVHLEEEDYEIMAEKKVGAAHCPSSNLKLKSGIADIKRLKDAGITVGIGTDGASSNNNLNMFEEMHIAALLSGVSAAEILKMATRNGALLQGRENCGLIKEGYAADLAVVDFDRAHLRPINDVVSSLVYSAQASDVVMTMVDGEILYKDGEYKYIDIESTVKRAEAALEEIKKKV